MCGARALGGRVRTQNLDVRTSEMKSWTKISAVVVLLAAIVCVPRAAAGYSVLTHEANIDALWDSRIQPLLVRNFPRATRAQLKDARAFAYGGSVIQDLGYYPFGSHFF